MMEPESVDLILSDLPFGTTRNTWDVIIPFDKLWEQYNRIRKKNTPIILFGQGMFTAKLMLSNQKMWRYNLVWDKGTRPSGHLNANRMPMRNHEDILIFYESLPTYNPQFREGDAPIHPHKRNENPTNNNYGKFIQNASADYGCRKFPISILRFNKPHPPIHPTQKPTKLIEYLVNTYSNIGDTVLDNCCGSGTTGVACVRTGRKFVCIEKEKKYVDISNRRIQEELCPN